MRPITFYIAGPMTGCEDYNYPAFHAAAETLRARGYDVLSPAELPAPNTANPTWTDWMRAALRTMLHADAVVVLKGWQRSALGSSSTLPWTLGCASTCSMNSTRVMTRW